MSSQDGSFIPTLTLQAQQSQQQHLTQRLIMSAHMHQAIRLLQLPLFELGPFIEEQIVSNPILEMQEEKEAIEGEEHEPAEVPENVEQEVVIDDKDFTILKQLEEEFYDHFEESSAVPAKRSAEEEKYKTYLENSICQELNLYQFLIQEAHNTFETDKEIAIAEILIGYIDENGFLSTPLKEIALLHGLEEAELQRLLKEIQTFEPYGVGASTIQESLLIQLRCLGKEQTWAYRIVKDHYTALIHNRIPLIQKELKCSLADIQQAIDQDIAKLNLHPGTHVSLDKSQVIIPDVHLRQEGEDLMVEVNRDDVPHLKLNMKYFKMLKDVNVPLETRSFIRCHIFSARWLMRNLQQRYSTIERIVDSLARRQKEFFTQPDGKLVPLTMKVLAEELHVHESTIARTVANKYLSSPRGIMPLRAFFTSGYQSEEGKDLSSRTVQDVIKEMIDQEDKRRPLSDEKICELLNNQGIPCARRTVTKYRSILQIGNTLQRKKF